MLNKRGMGRNGGNKSLECAKAVAEGKGGGVISLFYISTCPFLDSLICLPLYINYF